MGSEKKLGVRHRSLVLARLETGRVAMVTQQSWMFLRSFAMSAKQTGVPLGSAIAAVLLPSIALRFSWRFALIFAGIVIILSGLLSQILYQGHGNEVPLDDTDEISKDLSARPLPKKDMILLTHSYRIGWFFLCASMVGAFVMFGLIEEKGMTALPERTVGIFPTT